MTDSERAAGRGFHIRPMTVADLDGAAEVMRRGEWGDRRRYLSFLLCHPATHGLVAEAEGRVAGTGFATAHGDAGWLGMIFIAGELRGRGAGTAITRALCEHLEGEGCCTLVLVATEMGRPIYEKLGFAVETLVTEYCGPGSGVLPADPRLRPMRPPDLDAVRALDRRVTGEDRPPLLHAPANDGWVIDGAGGALAGFYAPAPWGGGIAIAEQPADGLLLLDLRLGLVAPRAETRVFLAAENTAGGEHLRQAGFRESRRQPRMTRGVPLAWRPAAIWGLSSLGMG